jgi:2-deoxy-D-gluconate 3-dehydrogenase
VSNLFRLDGKRALVTGCRRGIGRAMVVALAEAGAHIVGVSANLESTGSEVEREVQSLGREFKGYCADFSDRAAVRGFIDQLVDDFPQVDILVNNVGSIVRIPAVDHTDETWDRIIETNLTSQFVLSRELGRRMVARGEGKIICIGSVLSFQGGVLVPSYAASKGAIEQLVKALANEWAGSGVNVNGIAPGYVETDATIEIQNDPERLADILKRIPANRFGTPDDFKGIVVFLASHASDYMHGTLVTVDGGWMGR